MPKMKSRRSAVKRFKLTKSGKIKRSKAYAGHMFTSKTTKRKRQLRKDTLVHSTDASRVRRMLAS